MAIILLLILGASSVLYRLSKEKPLLKPDFLDSRFNTLALRPVRSKHPGTTDRSQEFAMDNRNQRSPARESAFPIQLDVLPEAFGWDHPIPGKTILDVRETSWGSDEGGVLIHYRHATGQEERLELQVSDIPALMKAWAAIRRQ